MSFIFVNYLRLQSWVVHHDEIKFGMMEDFCDIIVRNMDLADTVSTVRTYIFQTEYPAAFKHFTIGY